MRRHLVFALLALSLSSAPPSIIFEDVTSKSGLFDPLRGMMAHAAAWGDFDQDGLMDLFVGGYCDRPDSEYRPAKGPVSPKLFRNIGQGRFELVDSPAVAFCGRTSGAVFADLNQDMFPELYISNNAKIPPADAPASLAKKISVRSMLLQNQKGSLRDISQSSGACPAELMTTRSIAVLDYNLDGLPDLFVTEDKFQSQRRPRSVLLRNLGRLQFKVANEEASLPADIYGLGVAIADFNDDGRVDIFVSHSNRMFLSQGNRFQEVPQSDTVFQWQPLDSEDWPSGVAIGDLNRDGKLDLVLSVHHKPARNKVFLNQGVKNRIPQFVDFTSKVGLPESFPEKCPHVEIQDFDNDGWPDIYFSAAWRNGNKIVPLIYRNRSVERDGVPRFELSRKGEGTIEYFPAGPVADFDRDGRLDLFLANWFAGNFSHLLQNRTKAGNWIDVSAPIGSKIKLTSQGRLIGYQQVQTGFGYASGQPPVCHFGVADLRSVDVEVHLRADKIERRKSVAVNQRIQISQ